MRMWLADLDHSSWIGAGPWLAGASSHGFRPRARVTPGTNSITIVVTDNGVPPLQDAKTFLVMVQPPFQVASAKADGSGRIDFAFNSLRETMASISP